MWAPYWAHTHLQFGLPNLKVLFIKLINGSSTLIHKWYHVTLRLGDILFNHSKQHLSTIVYIQWLDKLQSSPLKLNKPLLDSNVHLYINLLNLGFLLQIVPLHLNPLNLGPLSLKCPFIYSIHFGHMLLSYNGPSWSEMCLCILRQPNGPLLVWNVFLHL